MNTPALLDTNIAIYAIKRRPLEVLNTFNRHHSRTAISSIALAELLHGVEKSNDSTRNFRALQDFISRLHTVTYDHADAAHHRQIRATLEKQG